MSHYVYSDTAVLVPATVKVFELPEGGWVTFENNQRRNVTKLRDAEDGIGIVNQALYPTDYFAKLAAQLNNIEAKIDLLLTKAAAQPTA